MLTRCADTYWRRRFSILTAGLLLFGVVAWATSGGGPAHPARGNATPRADAAASHATGVLPSAAGGSPAALPGGSPAASPAMPAAGSARAAASSPGATHGTAASSPGATRGTAATSAGARCAPGSIVLSLFPSQRSYTAGQQPTFEVYAVSTAPVPCRLAYGPPVVRVLVTRNGQVVWDSAACRTATAATKTIGFTQGVPHEAALSWDRKAASPACAGSLPARAKGIYEAVAMLDGESSPVRSFKLSH